MKQQLPKATPGLAKTVWQSQKRPSTRSVALAMTVAGYPVNFTTVARWKRQGWRANSKDGHPLDVARAKREAIAPLATRNAFLGEARDCLRGQPPFRGRKRKRSRIRRGRLKD